MTMALSESARATRASESRYRIDYPNYRPRLVRIFALDAESRAVIAAAGWADRTGISLADGPAAGPGAGRAASVQAWFQTLAGSTREALDAVAGADLVLMVASAAGSEAVAAMIGEACRAQGITVMSLVLQRQEAPEEALTAVLRELRPHSGMLVVASDVDYLDAALSALSR
jgi:hypothetical protein